MAHLETSLKGLALGLTLGGSTIPSFANAFENVFLPLDPALSDLDPFRWDNRVVLLFGENAEDERLRQAEQGLAMVTGALRERDIVVLIDESAAQGGKLREVLGIEGFAMLLVGKDGGVKLSRNAVISPDELFATIDAMPMRRREMNDG